MIKSFLKITLRNIMKHEVHSFINIIGLSIGITCASYILFYIIHERSFDNYHSDLDSIFRVAREFKTKSTESMLAITSPPLAPALKQNYPEVEFVARVLPLRNALVKRGQKAFYEKDHIITDTDIFGILSIPFLKGNPAVALDRPYTVVVTREVAEKYFGTEDAFGKTIEINQEEFEVTGIIKKCPINTHLKYNLILSLNTWKNREWMSSWWNNNLYTYIKLSPNVNSKQFEEKIRKISDHYIKERLEASGYSNTYFLQPIKDIHLYSHLEEEFAAPGSPLYLTIYSAVGVLILLIACFNFVNISTARSLNRAKEVGIRKVVGAHSHQLVIGYLGESLLISIFALCLSLVSAEVLLPYFNMLSGIHFTFPIFLNPRVLLILLGLTVLVGLAAGIYPAMFLSRFGSSFIFRGTSHVESRGVLLRKILVTGQFAVTTILIIGTLLVYRQLNFMKNRALGFELQQKLVIPLRGGISINKNYEAVKAQFLKYNGIMGAAISSEIMGRVYNTQGVELVGMGSTRRQVMAHLYIDTDFIPQYKIKMEAGRPFQQGISSDLAGAFIINESAAKALGFSSPREAIGNCMSSACDRGKIHPIIGVTKDFHYMGLTSKIRPLVMICLPERFSYLTLSIDKENLENTMAFVHQGLAELFPGNPLEPAFLEKDFNRQYNKEGQAAMLLGTLAFLGLFIASIGLLGLVSFTAVQRKKEISIRKVLGSTVPGIVLLLSKEFTKLVTISNLIAWPIAYYVMYNWFEQFPYRAGIGVEVFIITSVFVLFIAFFPVGFQSIKAAVVDPAKILKNE
jgi:putative ABC transport system permease protein